MSPRRHNAHASRRASARRLPSASSTRTRSRTSRSACAADALLATRGSVPVPAPLALRTGTHRRPVVVPFPSPPAAPCPCFSRAAEFWTPEDEFNWKLDAVKPMTTKDMTKRRRGGLLQDYCVFCYHGTSQMRPEVRPCVPAPLPADAGARPVVTPVSRVSPEHHAIDQVRQRRRADPASPQHQVLCQAPAQVRLACCGEGAWCLPCVTRMLRRSLRAAVCRLRRTIKRARVLQLMPFNQRLHPKLRATQFMPDPVRDSAAAGGGGTHADATHARNTCTIPPALDVRW